MLQYYLLSLAAAGFLTLTLSTFSCCLSKTRKKEEQQKQAKAPPIVATEMKFATKNITEFPETTQSTQTVNTLPMDNSKKEVAIANLPKLKNEHAIGKITDTSSGTTSKKSNPRRARKKQVKEPPRLELCKTLREYNRWEKKMRKIFPEMSDVTQKMTTISDIHQQTDDERTAKENQEQAKQESDKNETLVRTAKSPYDSKYLVPGLMSQKETEPGTARQHTEEFSALSPSSGRSRVDDLVTARSHDSNDKELIT